MNYTPKDLENLSFKREFIYGYQRKQIDKVLSKMREDYELLLQEREGFQAENTIMRETVQHYKTIEESLQHTLILAQRTSEEIVKGANQKADNIIREADVRAQKIIDNANQQKEGIQQEFEEIKKRLNIYKVKSQALLTSTMEIIKDAANENDN